MSEYRDREAAFGLTCVLLILIAGVLFFAFQYVADKRIALRDAVERRGFDPNALEDETSESYWKALATGRVADPQPVKEVDGGR